ncbi:MAG TPA: acetyl-CoA carboxylase carboxyltransferase subunit alpha [Armatimonadota bacterium]
MSRSRLDFEKKIGEVEAQIQEIRDLKHQAEIQGESPEQLARLEGLILDLEHDLRGVMVTTYSNLSRWDKTRMARHELRPYSLDYARLMCEDFTELHGDRLFGDDGAIVGGLARLGGRSVLLVGHQKGRDAKERVRRNFGSAKPEGYRKALRLMKMAEKLGRPIVCLVDTPAADASPDAEERGISTAIAENSRDMSLLGVPVIVVVIGEGGSGGAIGLGVGDRVLMLEHSVYSVIPPEGCAAIIWRDKGRGVDAAECLKLTAQDALSFGVVDEVLPEPLGGAHRDYEAAASAVREAVLRHLLEVESLGPEEMLEQRYQRFRRQGVYFDSLLEDQAGSGVG